MNSPLHVHSLTVTDDQARKFFVGIENTLRTMTATQLTHVYFLNQNLRAVNISYNASYQPFFGFTAGFTLEEDRVYLLENIWVIDRIGEYLAELNLGIPGGRIQINSTMAYKKLDDNTLVHLCLFDWQGEDVWAKSRQIINQLRLARNIM